MILWSALLKERRSGVAGTMKKVGGLKGKIAGGSKRDTYARTKETTKSAQEVRNALFCPLQEKLHTGVLKGVRNISSALQILKSAN